MNSQQETDLMRQIILMVSYKDDLFHGVAAALLYRALAGGDFTAACLPSEITQGDIHVAGLAVKMLAKIGLIIPTGYAPSPNPNAKGRVLRNWTLAPGKESTARTLLSRWGYVCTQEAQQSLAI